MPGGTGGDIVHKLKYSGWTALAEPMAEQMARLNFPRDVAEERDLLVPVPLAPSRARERGYNQSELLARLLGAHWNVSVGEALVRRRATETQTRLTPGDRLRNVAGAFEIGDEFGARGPYAAPVSFAESGRTKREYLSTISNTTIAIVATDADLSKAQLKRLAVAAQDGMARAISPSHSLVDGDIVFAASNGAKPVIDPIFDTIALGHAAAVCLARAIARAVYLATPADGDLFPTWQQKWGK